MTIPQCTNPTTLISGEVTPGGTANNVTLTVDGVRYTPPTGTCHTNSAFYDNPFNWGMPKALPGGRRGLRHLRPRGMFLSG
ncbi:hypothetical protein GCM10009555_066430 [Acrocarpospora macrocephala]|uniref:Uncharacterized protein n=1 Tax=Acrocarpospora macrocephala TaxID=150177 RepID=A0A5M3X3G2_9ACTN|nr:hypothetical protein Amac_069700 [Acrocarpospora macrocephala]